VLKLFRPGTSAEQVTREADATRAARTAGAPAPAVFDVVEVRGRWGIVFERVVGPTLLQVLADRPAEAADRARDFAALHARLHALPGTGLPSQRERLRTDIDRAALPDELRTGALAALDGLPDGAAVCHGDFHPLNLIATPAGLVALDWYNASCGHPLADVARTVLLLEFTGLPRYTDAAVRQAVDGVRAAFLAGYRAAYAALRPFAPDELRAWTVPVAAARLAKDVSAGERAFLLTVVRTGLGR
jgi:uncharacterized protein (TIGR02172 family)